LSSAEIRSFQRSKGRLGNFLFLLHVPEQRLNVLEEVPSRRLLADALGFRGKERKVQVQGEPTLTTRQGGAGETSGWALRVSQPLDGSEVNTHLVRGKGHR